MDRIDVNRGYEPGNVRWATSSFTDEQLRYKAVKDRITSLRKEADELERGLEPCTHPVVKEEAGWTYATRRCLICGGSELV